MSNTTEMEPRIAPLMPPYSSDLQQLFDKVMPPGQDPLILFRTIGRNQRVLSRVMAGGLLDRGTLTLRQRELMILRTCANCGCEYEWGVHVTIFAQAATLVHADITATLSRGTLPGEDGAIFKLADHLHDHAMIDDELWMELKSYFSNEQLIELMMLAGFYHSISYIANGLRIDQEPMAARFGDYQER
jgi:alkylhydroperoxidase family enzyme